MDHSQDKSVHAASIFNKYAEDYQNKFMNVNLYKDSLNLFCNFITKPNSKILDIACGPGNVAKYLLNKIKSLTLLGLDLAPNMVDLAKKNNPNAHFEVMDCRLVAQLSGKFEAVICAFCLPYITKDEVNKLLFDIHNLLSQNGVVFISTIEGNYSNSGYEKSSKNDDIFIQYYDEFFLILALKNYHFTISDISRIESIMGNGKKVTDLIIIASKQTGL